VRAVNLLPREPKLGRKRLSVVAQLAIGAPLVVAGLVAAGYLLASSSVNERKTTLAAARAELAALPPPIEQPQANLQLAVLRDQRVAALATALQSRLAWDRILREISAVLPGDVWLTNLSGNGIVAQPAPATTASTGATGATGAAPPAVPAPTAGPVTFAGYTYSQEGVARLLGRLAVIPALQDVKLLSSTQSSVSGRFVFSFSITADVRTGEIG